MSDIGDYDDADFDQLDYFYVEDCDDEPGDIAGHAIASPPPIDFMDEGEWDRFEYWNDIEYDSDGYYDVTALKEKRKSQRGSRISLKRKAVPAANPGKRRKGADGKSLDVHHDVDVAFESPVVWHARPVTDDPPPTAGKQGTVALLKDWRSRFPEDGEKSDDSPPPAVLAPASGSMNISEDALRQALQANLSALSSGASSGSREEALILEQLTHMLAGGGSADAVAGELADMLFAQDGETTDEGSDAGGGDFGQWVLGRAEEQARGSQEQKAEDATPSQTSVPHGRKRKADGGSKDTTTAAAKRVATRSFDAPTASSRARTASKSADAEASAKPKAPKKGARSSARN